MRKLLLPDRVVDGAIHMTWGLMIPAFVYFVLAKWVFAALPGLVTAPILCMVGAGAGTIYGTEKYLRGKLQRFLAAILSGLMFVIVFFGAKMLIQDFGGLSSPLRFMDVTLAYLIICWGFYLYLSTALRQREQPPALVPRFLTESR